MARNSYLMRPYVSMRRLHAPVQWPEWGSLQVCDTPQFVTAAGILGNGH